MLLRSSSSPLLNSLNNPLKEGNESDLNVPIRKCKSVQLSPTSAGVIAPVSHQLHIAEDCSANWFHKGGPSASPEFRRAKSDGNLQQHNLTSPRRQWSRRCCSRNHDPSALAAAHEGRQMPGEISLEEVLRNGRLDESLEEIEDCGSGIHVSCLGRDSLGNELQSSESHMVGGYRIALSEGVPARAATVECVEGERTSGSGRKAESLVSMGGEGHSGVGVESSGVALVCRKPAVAHHGSEHELCPMYIAGGFGDGGGRSGGGGCGGRGGSSGSDSNSTDAYYQKMLEANPGHPLLLRNYARFLHEVLRDYPKAEEYYGRAILANPGDGDVLSLYAKLIWDVHRDAGRAEAYFDRAVQAAPDDCYVLGSYAHFLWNAEDDDDGEDSDDGAALQHNMIPPAFYGTTTATPV